MKYKIEFRIGHHLNDHLCRDGGWKHTCPIEAQTNEDARLAIKEEIKRLRQSTLGSIKLCSFVRVDQEEKTSPITLDL